MSQFTQINTETLSVCLCDCDRGTGESRSTSPRRHLRELLGRLFSVAFDYGATHGCSGETVEYDRVRRGNTVGDVSLPGDEMESVFFFDSLV